MSPYALSPPHSRPRSRRERLPHRSTLSRFLAALDQAPVEALRNVFLEDLLARPLEKEETTGGLWDRQGTRWLVFDVDGTRQAARQRALPSTSDLPPAQRRLDEVCAPGYRGRKRGETVRTRTTVLQAIHINGLARFLEHRAQATAITEENYGRLYRGSACI